MSQPLTVTGQGAPGDTIELIVGNTVLGRTATDADGAFAFALTFTSPGLQFLTVRTLDAAGNALSSNSVAYIIVNPQPTPTNTAVPPQADTDILRSGLAVRQETQLTGQGEPGTTVRLLLGDQVVSEGKVAANGRWVLPLSVSRAGQYSVPK